MDLLKHYQNTAEAPGPRLSFVYGTPLARGLAVRRVTRWFARRSLFDLSAVPQAEVEDFIAQGNVWGVPRLIVVEQAHRWEGTASLKKWKARSDDYLLMHSGLKGWKPDRWPEEFSPDLKEYLSPNVVNTEFTHTAAGTQKLITLVQGLAGFPKWEAKTLVDAAGRSTEEALVTALRLRALGGFSLPALNALIETQPPDFTEALLAGRKADAVAALWSMEKVPQNAIQRLYKAVVLVSLIGRNRRTGETPFALASRLNVHRGIIERYIHLTKYSDPGSTFRRIGALNSAQPVWEKAKTDDERRELLLVLTAVW